MTSRWHHSMQPPSKRSSARVIFPVHTGNQEAIAGIFEKLWLQPVMIKFIYAIAIVSLAGCATSGSYTLKAQSGANLDESLKNGEIRLACELACSGAFGYNQSKMKELHNNSLWTNLALTVANIGYDEDLSYYYLGRSAEGLGYYDAAKIYYALAQNSNRCNGVINVCDGFKFPDVINQRFTIIAEIESQSIRQQALTRQQEKSYSSLSNASESSWRYKAPPPIQFNFTEVKQQSEPSDNIRNNAPEPRLQYKAQAPIQVLESLSSFFAYYNLDVSRGILSGMLKGAWSDDTKAIDNGLQQVKSQVRQPQRGDRRAARQANKSGIESLRNNDIAEAVRQLTHAANADPGDQEIVNNLAMALHKANHLDDAHLAALAALTLSPERTLAWFEMATILADEGKSDAAVSAFLIAYRFSKGQQKTIESLLAVSQDISQTPQVRQAAHQAVIRIQEKSPKRPLITDGNTG